jgi:hypothetical protein
MSGFLQAQKSTHSPYSRYGVGIYNQARFNGNFAQGGVGYAWRPQNYKPQVYDSLAKSDANLNDRGTNYINPKNPASFSNFSLTTFEAGIFSHNVELTSGNQSETENASQLSHMSLAFPIANSWGVALGIRPFSKVGYDYHQTTSTFGRSVDNQFDGNGTVNEIFLGTALELFNQFSVGVNGSFYFGTLVDERRVVFDNGSSDNFFNTLDKSETQIKDFGFDVGAQYFTNLNSNYRLTLGATVSPVSDLSAERTRLVRNYEGDENFETFKDTIVNVQDQKVDLAIAPTYGGGVSIEKRGEWMIGVDYTMRNWGGEEVSSGIKFENSHIINLGFEKFNNISAFGSYLKQMGYRAGARYNSSVVNINGEDVEEFGISFGIAMPLRKSYSTLNLGLELGRRGKDEAGLTEENFINLQFGITINDKWFIQRKYD